MEQIEPSFAGQPLGDSYLDAATNLLVDVRDIYYASSRKQILDNKELLVQNRNEMET